MPLPPAVVCNPVDLPYRYQDVRPLLGRRSVHREGADPSVVLFRGRYYLFVSLSRGFFHSSDLRTWSFRSTDRLPALDYAPDVSVIDGALYICASRRLRASPIFRSVDPLEDDFTEIATGGFPFWDPHLFQDDDGRTYLYWGCSSRAPVRGREVDPSTFQGRGERRDLISSDAGRHGWERRGGDSVRETSPTLVDRISDAILGDGPFLEGAWMTRHGDQYHLQYAAPATQSSAYADGVVTASSPLGPFEPSPHNPYSSKPGGFVTGAGHGSTFQDVHGNWWHTATMRISVNHVFERRIGLFPAGFDADGVLFCNQNFADYPMVVPDGPFDPWRDAFAGWMLLSYHKSVVTSSEADGRPGSLAVNEDIRSWWTAGSPEEGEWIQVDLGEDRVVAAIQVNLADAGVARFAPRCADGRPVIDALRAVYPDSEPTEMLIEVSEDGVVWQAISDTRGSGVDAPHRMTVLESPRPARFVRVTAGRMPFGSPFAVSGLRVFGTKEGPLPVDVEVMSARVDQLTAELQWVPVAGADGYNVRYGLAPDKLYHSWMVYDRTRLQLPTLTAGRDYWVAVDSFGETGITEGEPVLVPAP